MHTKHYTPEQLTDLLTSESPAGMLVLYDVYAKALYNVLLTMLHNEKKAQEALCDAFAAMRKDRSSYNPAVSSPFTWMLRKAVATAMLHTGDKDKAAFNLKKAFLKKPAKKWINRNRYTKFKAIGSSTLEDLKFN